MALSSFAGGRLWGARHGSGPFRLLALPGWAHDHHDFDAVLAGLDAVALDLPGFGAAPPPPGPWSTAQYAELVATVLEELVPPVVVLGHSFGARVAVWLARDPRVAGLVLTGAPLAPVPGHRRDQPAAAFRVGRTLHRVGLLGPERMEQLRQRYGSLDYRQASGEMRGVLVKAVKETAESAYLPALQAFLESGRRLELVWGEGDRVASLEGLCAGLGVAAPGASVPSTAPALARTTFVVRTTVVPGAGHLLTPAFAGPLRDAVSRLAPAVP